MKPERPPSNDESNQPPKEGQKDVATPDIWKENLLGIFEGMNRRIALFQEQLAKLEARSNGPESGWAQADAVIADILSIEDVLKKDPSNFSENEWEIFETASLRIGDNFRTLKMWCDYFKEWADPLVRSEGVEQSLKTLDELDVLAETLKSAELKNMVEQQRERLRPTLEQSASMLRQNEQVLERIKVASKPLTDLVVRAQGLLDAMPQKLKELKTRVAMEKTREETDPKLHDLRVEQKKVKRKKEKPDLIQRIFKKNAAEENERRLVELEAEIKERTTVSVQSETELASLEKLQGRLEYAVGVKVPKIQRFTLLTPRQQYVAFLEYCKGT